MSFSDKQLADPFPQILRSALAQEDIRKIVKSDGVSAIRLPFSLTDPCHWLACQSLFPRVYLNDRSSQYELAAVGELQMSASTREDFSALRDEDLHPDVYMFRAYGFDPEQTREGWESFSDSGNLLPRFILEKTDGLITLTIQLTSADISDDGDAILKEYSKLIWDEEFRPEPFPGSKSAREIPGKEEWIESCAAIIRDIRDGKLNKAVLGRKTEITGEAPFSAASLLDSLKRSAPGCFVFCWQPDKDAAFLGATPERLFSREGMSIQTEAIAGTCPSSEAPADCPDENHPLTLSEKNRKEQDIVVREIERTLKNSVDDFQVTRSCEILRLPSTHHLVTQFEGRLNEGVTDFQLVEALHPTPAVAGEPRDAALAALREKEPFDRGLYAGALGWRKRGRSEWIVGIRSALVNGSELSVFAGAGIVAESDPQSEWNEVDHKTQSILAMFLDAKDRR